MDECNEPIQWMGEGEDTDHHVKGLKKKYVDGERGNPEEIRRTAEAVYLTGKGGIVANGNKEPADAISHAITQHNNKTKQKRNETKQNKNTNKNKNKNQTQKQKQKQKNKTETKPTPKPNPHPNPNPKPNPNPNQNQKAKKQNRN